VKSLNAFAGVAYTETSEIPALQMSLHVLLSGVTFTAFRPLGGYLQSARFIFHRV
jgi:hypothetical protein